MCKLYCRVKHDSTYYLLRDKVRDGTKCTVNSFDICVNGMCKPAGCDNVLDSNVTLGKVVSRLTESFWGNTGVVDECAICNGDNSLCEEISGTYNLSSYGYNKVVTIPKGSSNIVIVTKGFDDHYLGKEG